MNLRQRRRLYFVLALVTAAAGATALSLFALRQNIQYFRSPSDIYAHHPGPDESFRLGGVVAKGSLVKGPGGEIRFAVSDGRARISVHYTGMLPALFSEGAGVVASGHLAPSGVFLADQVLAKHDEKYMPAEVADALKRNGRWQETAGQRP
jgi:cytochrome c-type biogenesis protein CcmE